MKNVCLVVIASFLRTNYRKKSELRSPLWPEFKFATVLLIRDKFGMVVTPDNPSHKIGEIYETGNQNEINLTTPCPTNLFHHPILPPPTTTSLQSFIALLQNKLLFSVGQTQPQELNFPCSDPFRSNLKNFWYHYVSIHVTSNAMPFHAMPPIRSYPIKA